MTTSEQIKLFCVGLSVMLKERPPHSSERTDGPSDCRPLETVSSTELAMPQDEVPAKPGKS